MSYADIYNSAVVADSRLRRQIAVALHKAATDISVEGEQTPKHSQRVAWARQVFADPVGWSSRVVWIVLQNPVIAASPDSASDDDVQFVVNGNIDVFFNLA